MKDEKLFSRISDEEAARIAEEYHTGGKEQRDRIFNEIERRVERGDFTSGDEVRGVETYRPRIWLKAVSAAAAFVLIAGAATGGGYLLLRNGGTASPGTEATEPATEPETAEEATEEETAGVTEEDTQLTGEEIIAKIKGRDYDAYDQLSIRYNITMNSGASCEHCIAKRDRITGNESLMRTWTHTAEYYRDVDPDIIAEWGTTLEKLVESVTRNEMFMYKDLYVCVYSDTSTDEPDQYEAYSRSICNFDQPNIFCNMYSEYLISYGLDDYEIQDINGNVSFIGRECTEVRMHLDGRTVKAEAPHGSVPVTITPEGPVRENENYEPDNDLTLTVDNETGFILRARLDYEGGRYEEFNVEEIRFNEEAELPEDAAYIKERISDCIPTDDITAKFNLSTLDE